MHKTSKHCLNCNHKLTRAYCTYCGQAADTSRISFRHLADELQHGFLHIDKGLLYTVKELILRPGMTIHNYLDGKRVSYAKPFLFLLLWGATYSLLFHFSDYFPMEKMNPHNTDFFNYIPLYAWFSTYYSLTTLLLIPFYGLSTYLLFHKQGYNYVEHLVAFSYLYGVKIFFLIICFPLIYYTCSRPIYQSVHLLAELYLITGLTQFFREKSWIRTSIQVIMSLVLAIIGMLIILLTFYALFKANGIRV